MSNEEFDEELTEIIEHLIDLGALEIEGYDSISDSFTYRVTDKCKEIYPEFYQAHYESVGEIATSLWMKDVIDVVFTDGQVVIGVTADQLKNIRENMLNFSEDERLFLDAIINKYDNQSGV